MISALLKRLLQSFVALALLILFSFFLSRVLPGDPAKYILTFNNSQVVSSMDGRIKSYERQYRKMGLHLPYFYFSVESRVLPDSFVRLPASEYKLLLCSLSYFSGEPQKSYAWVNDLSEKNSSYRFYDELRTTDVQTAIDHLFLLPKEGDAHFGLQKRSWELLKEHRSSNVWKKWVPVIRWNSENQFHYWLFGQKNLNGFDESGRGIVQGNFGVSWARGGDVFEMIKFPFLLTLVLSIFILFVSFPLSLALGGWMALHQNHWHTRIQKPLLVFLYSVPTFWMGTALLLFFSNPRMLDWLPIASPVLVTNEGLTIWFDSLVSQKKYLIIPLITLGYSTVIYMAQLVVELLGDELRKPYVLTLRAVGYPEWKIIFYFTMKNILVPVIVSLMSVFPLLLGGSVIIDFLFTMPGLGTLMLQACDQKDFPVISAVLFVSGFVTILSFTLTDVLTSWANPLIRTNHLKRNG